MTDAVKIRNSDNIVFDNVHIFSQTRLPFDNAVLEEGSGVAVRANNFTHLVGEQVDEEGGSPAAPHGLCQGDGLGEARHGLRQRDQSHGR